MEETTLRILTSAYIFTGILNVAAYWPTIKDLYYYKKPSANLNSYALWTVTSGTNFLYVMTVLNDFYVQAVSGAIFLICATILLLCLKLKCDNTAAPFLSAQSVSRTINGRENKIK